jgi:cytochrome c
MSFLAIGKAARRRSIIVAAALLLGAGGAHAGDPAAGERVFRKCLPCHAVGEGAQIKVGPVLNGLLGRPAGTYPNYNYTDANKNSKFVWDEPTLANYLKNPKAAIPGTKMEFAGLPRPNEIEDVIAFLKQFGPDGKKK